MRTRKLYNEPADDATPLWDDVTDVLVLYLTGEEFRDNSRTTTTHVCARNRCKSKAGAGDRLDKEKRRGHRLDKEKRMGFGHCAQFAASNQKKEQRSIRARLTREAHRVTCRMAQLIK